MTSALLIAVLSAATLTAADTRQALELAAKQLQAFDTGELLYNRSPDSRDGAEAMRDDGLLRPLRDAGYSKEELIALLKHRDPKVRTLAMFLLFDKEDPSVLVHFLLLTTDQSQTLPHPVREVYVTYPMRRSTKPQTVGNVATAFLQFYLDQAGSRESGFAEYWERRNGLPRCASWTRVKLLRASGAMTPLQTERLPRIRKVRAFIDAFPTPDRELTLLILGLSMRESGLVSEAELVAAARSLGRRRILQFLGGEPPTNDPDLLPGNNKYHEYFYAVGFLLERADLWLWPQDVGRLYAAEKALQAKTLGLADVWRLPWKVAEARLVPSRASELLKTAIQKFEDYRRSHPQSWPQSETGVLAAHLLKLRGKNEAVFLVDWFFLESKRGEQSSFVTEPFFTRVNSLWLFQRLFSHPSIEYAGAYSVMRMLDAVSGSKAWSPRLTQQMARWVFQHPVSQMNPWELGIVLHHLWQPKYRSIFLAVVDDPRFLTANWTVISEICKALIGDWKPLNPERQRQIARKESSREMAEMIRSEIRGIR
jgi:hypothetical protein